MRPPWIKVVAVLIVLLCVVCYIAEICDTWDSTLQRGSDTEFSVVRLLLCIGAALVCAQLLCRLCTREWSNRITMDPHLLPHSFHVAAIAFALPPILALRIYPPFFCISPCPNYPFLH